MALEICIRGPEPAPLIHAVVEVLLNDDEVRVNPEGKDQVLAEIVSPDESHCDQSRE
jgi:hypothetical protein